MKIGNVAFDCADPDRMSTFWAAALDYQRRTWPDDLRQTLLAAGLTEADLAGRGPGRGCFSNGSPRGNAMNQEPVVTR